MSENWKSDAEWTPQEEINNGQEYTGDDSPSANDFNRIVENLQYLYLTGTSFNVNPYPVGSFYFSDKPDDPAFIFGGTWEQIKDKFLLSAGDTYTAGSEGGSANAVVVRHNHYVPNNYGDAVNMSAGYYVANSAIGLSNSTFTGTWLSTDYMGEDGTGKNMPPYLTVYIWKRIA